MAFEAYDDYEQGERVQQWLRRNGWSIIIGIVIGLVGIFGWQQWTKHKASHEAEAASLYHNIQTAASRGSSSVETLTEQLLQNYADTTYAAFAAGDRAKRQVRANQLDQALVSLDWAQTHTSDADLKALFQLRSAQVLLAQNKFADAIAVLDSMPPQSYQGIAQELRGDVLIRQGRPDDARKAYEIASKAYEAAEATQGDQVLQELLRSLQMNLQMKINDLAVAGKQGT